MRLVLAGLLLLPLAGYCQSGAKSQTATLDRAFERLYNFDFKASHAVLDELQLRDPSDPLTYAVRSAAILFSELHRLRILETEFFVSDEKVKATGGPKPKTDPLTRAQLMQAIGEARRRAEARLAADPSNRDAMSALCMATGVETDYTVLVEKRLFRSLSLSRQAQAHARRLLELNPPEADAYLTLGSVEYVVGSMNFLFRLFIRFDQVKGSKEQGIENLKKVVANGRRLGPFAKILLAVIYLREKQPQAALQYLTELGHDYPENPLIRHEIARIGGMVERTRILPKGAQR